jgi:hypothetical protein
MAEYEQGATSFLDRSGFGALFISAMLTISVGSIYICFLAR